MNKKYESYEGGVQREKKKEKTCFVSWKVYWILILLFFVTPFPLHFKDDF